jgi:hypothetical protein
VQGKPLTAPISWARWGDTTDEKGREAGTKESERWGGRTAEQGLERGEAGEGMSGEAAKEGRRWASTGRGPRLWSHKGGRAGREKGQLADEEPPEGGVSVSFLPSAVPTQLRSIDSAG